MTNNSCTRISTFFRRAFALVVAIAITVSCCPLDVFAARPGPGSGKPGDDTSSSGNTSVDHIDIAIDLTATVFINGQEKKIDFTLTTEDAQYVTITAEPSDTQFSLSGGVSTSSDNAGNAQIRIEGDFPVGTSTSPISYTVTLSKTLIVDGNVPVDVTLSTTMHYWDSGNVCPGFQEKPGNMSGIDLDLADTGRGCLLIQKTINGAALEEAKSFDFQVLTEAGELYKELSITVPAGQTTASVILANLDLGTYTIREVTENAVLDGYDLISTTYTNGGIAVLSSANNFVSCNVTNTYNEKQPEHIHHFEAQTIDPTCTEKGYTVYECECGETYEAEEQPPLGHSYSSTTTDPTCTEGGHTEHVCSKCDDSYIDAETPATGHHYSSTITEPTCETDGYTTYICPDCGDTYISDLFPAPGHDFTITVVESTCTEEGYSIYVCTCGERYEADKKEALGHSYINTVTNPTCTESGHTEHYCPQCGDAYIDSETPATGHHYSETVTDPTCEQDGFTTYACSDCGYSYVADIIPSPGHHYTVTVIDPTCTENGYSVFECDCGSTYQDNETLAPGHSYSKVVTAPTCTEGGHTEHVCSECGDAYIDAEAPANGHSYSKVVTAPTCDKDGYTTFTCTVCGHSYITDIIPAPGHQCTVTIIEPTCTEEGYTIYQCDCGETYEADEQSPLGHNYIDTVTDPTCEEGGYTEHTCSKCEDTYTDSELPATGHLYSEVVAEPTCEQDGYTTYTCPKCGDTYTADPIPSPGHAYSSTVTPPTTEAEGYTEHTCTECGKSYRDDVTAKLPKNGSLEISMAISNALLLQDTQFTFDVCNEAGEVVLRHILVTVPAGSNVGTLCLTDIPAGAYTIIRNAIDESTYLAGDAETASVEILPEEEADAAFTANLATFDISITTTTADGAPLPGIVLLLEWSSDEGNTWNPAEAVPEGSLLQPGQCTTPALEDSGLASDETGCVEFSDLYPGLEYRVIAANTTDDPDKQPEVLYCGELLFSVEFTSEFSEIPADFIPTTGDIYSETNLLTSVSAAMIVSLSALFALIAMRKTIFR